MDFISLTFSLQVLQHYEFERKQMSLRLTIGTTTSYVPTNDFIGTFSAMIVTVSSYTTTTTTVTQPHPLTMSVSYPLQLNPDCYCVFGGDWLIDTTCAMVIFFLSFLDQYRASKREATVATTSAIALFTRTSIG